MQITEELSFAFQNILAQTGIDFSRVVFGNTLFEYALAAAWFVIFLIIFKIFQIIVVRYLRRFAERTKTDIDDTLIEIVRSLRPPFYSFLAFYLALQFVTLNSFIEKAISIVLIIWVTYQVVAAADIFINYLIKKWLAKDKDKTTGSALRLLGSIAKGAVWGAGILMVLDNIGVNVTSLLAGIGIGGIAIAFALQNILADLFSSFAIYFDKPFKVGDFIIVGDKLGTVEKIGIKTTRLRALGGEELVMSNQALTGAEVQNYGRMEKRRVVFSLGILYETDVEKIKKVSKIIKDIITDMKEAKFDRAHFKEFGESSLDFEVVYYVTKADYNKYMDIQEEINIKLVEAFAKEEIEFAYPVVDIRLNKDSV